MSLENELDIGVVQFPWAVIPEELPHILGHVAQERNYRVGLREENYTDFEPKENGVQERKHTPESRGCITRLLDITCIEFSVIGDYHINDKYLITGIRLCVPGQDDDEYSKEEKEVIADTKESVNKYFAERNFLGLNRSSLNQLK